MSRRTSLPLVCLLTVAAAIPHGFGQDQDDKEALPPRIGAETEQPQDLNDKFQKLENPPLAGLKGDRQGDKAIFVKTSKA